MNAGMTGDVESFDYSQYPTCFADEVTAELANPEPERSLIGLVAAEILRSAGWRP